MTTQTPEPVTKEVVDRYIQEAAEAAGYEKGFGIEGCDLSKPIWWVAYCRQSEEEQAHNNRLPDYLHTCALEAKRLGVEVPREYVLYDVVTGEHLERPKMIYLRRLMEARQISGAIFPALDRLSREPLHQQIFELEAAHYGIQLQYADAPSGNDPGSQFARTILAHAAKLVKIANRKNNRGGNIGRVINRNVPAGKTSYGYRYHAEYDDLGHGRRRLVTASWLVEKLGSDGELEWGSEAWAVTTIFRWVGAENRTLYWVAKELNRLGVRPRYAYEWSPALISFIVKNRCYIGRHTYNKGAYVPNPKTPIRDVTAAIKRTVRRTKPESEWVHFDLPPLVSQELWDLANRNLRERGRGKGKEGKQIDALLRGRVYCPSCGRLMRVYRDSSYRNLTYYVCTGRTEGWKQERCRVRSFRIDWLDGVVWDCVYALLKQPGWVEEQLKENEGSSQLGPLDRLLRLERQKVERAKAKIRRVQDSYEANLPIYTNAEAREKIELYRKTITLAEAESRRLEAIKAQESRSQETMEAALHALEAIRDANLDNASFIEMRDLIAKLGIKVYPSGEEKVVRISSVLRLNPSPVVVSPQIISIASPKL